VLMSEDAQPLASELMLQPERDIPDEAAGIHGITTEQARKLGMDRAEGIRKIASKLQKWVAPDRPLVGHNLSYDLTVLDREMRRVGAGRVIVSRGLPCISTPEGLQPFYAIDTFVLDKGVDKYRPGTRKLEPTAEYYGVPMESGSAHGAVADVIASIRIAIRIAGRSRWDLDDLIAHYRDRKNPGEVAQMFRSIGTLDLPEFYRVQVGWAMEQAVSLRAHFRKTGKDWQSVSTEWPIRSVPDGEQIETVSTGEEQA
jgi:DNA polymerase-3 subunit epsilon